MERPSLFILLALASAASAVEPTLSRFEYEEPHMGTLFRIVLYAANKEQADRGSKAAFARVAQLNGIMSDYLATSELMQLCKTFSTQIGEPVPVSPELFFVLSKGKEIAERSAGSFDVTVGPLVKLWRVSRKTMKLPDPKELAEAKKKVGFAHMELDATKRTVKLLVPGMQLDLGGIAKGYAADEVLAVLAKHQITRAMVAAGGDIAVSDPPPGATGWKIEIGKLTKNSERRIVLLKNAAVSTSGDIYQFVEIDGVRYSHLLDPRTGLGLTGRRTVTVIAPKGILADSLTKPASILPPADALALLADMKAETLIVQLKNDKEETITSKGFDAYLWKEEK